MKHIRYHHRILTSSLAHIFILCFLAPLIPIFANQLDFLKTSGHPASLHHYLLTFLVLPLALVVPLLGHNVSQTITVMTRFTYGRYVVNALVFAIQSTLYFYIPFALSMTIFESASIRPTLKTPEATIFLYTSGLLFVFFLTILGLLLFEFFHRISVVLIVLVSLGIVDAFMLPLIGTFSAMGYLVMPLAIPGNGYRATTYYLTMSLVVTALYFIQVSFGFLSEKLALNSQGSYS